MVIEKWRANEIGCHACNMGAILVFLSFFFFSFSFFLCVCDNLIQKQGFLTWTKVKKKGKHI